MEKIEKDNLYSPLLIFGVIILFALFYFFPNNDFKLISGGSFLIALSIIELLRNKNKFLAIPALISGIFALIVAFLLPNYISFFLLLFYFGFFIIIIFLFGFYVKKGDRFQSNQKIAELFFRLLYLILAIMLISIIFILIDSALNSYLSAEIISKVDYALFIIILFTSLFSFYLFIDNIIRIVIAIMGSSEIFPKIYYRAYYSFFLSLSFLIIVGGYYYINNQGNEIFQKLMIIIGLAFFTSLIVTSSLRNLLNKDN